MSVYGVCLWLGHIYIYICINTLFHLSIVRGEGLCEFAYSEKAALST